ncbi:helix-turn-helix domain-containing protein, partial [Brevundimonas aurantiaca]|uniref:helix-turn-helix domain-containing protein n=1 Tax=Brevundimonas aurantiaca TaxID=74316 RepID=UPI00174A6591
MEKTNDPFDIALGSRVRAQRMLIGMSQKALATAMAVSFQQLQKYESGENRIVRRQRLWHRSGVADNGGIGSRRSDVRNADETQSLQPKIGCQA